MLCAERQQVERLRHAAHLIERQYRHSDPENRLVTSEFERRWGAALRDLRTAEEKLQLREQQSECWAIPADLLEMLKQVGLTLPELWEPGVLSWPQKTVLLRSLIDKVVLKRENDRVTMRVVWCGGDAAERVVRVTVGRFEQLSGTNEIEQTIVAMAMQRRTDREIADHLTTEGHRSPRANRSLPSTVARARMDHGILHKEGRSHPHLIPGYLRALQLAKKLGIKPRWIYDRIRSGVIRVEKDAQHNTYLFPDQPETLQQFRKLVDGKVQTLN